MHVAEPDRMVRESLVFLQKLLVEHKPCNFDIQFWDGTIWHAEPCMPATFTLVLKHPGALRRMFWPPNQLTIGEAFIYDDFDIKGDILDAFKLGETLLNLRWGLVEKMHYGRHLLSLPSGDGSSPAQRRAVLDGALHSSQRDRQAVTYHYNISNDFYRIWLDERMVYSCGYFVSSEEDLDQAQKRKLDYICRKLRLKAGERFLDIGCGWGSLVVHAAKNYGVKALGVTLSRPQAELATERIRRAGLEDRCRVEVCDYREVDGEGRFDKLASVGMFEHVGTSQLDEYFERAWRLLRPGGVFLNHGIASSLSDPFPAGPSFIDRYVFPDGELLPISTTIRSAEQSGFEVRDLESLREHYALTLRHWLRRLEGAYDVVLRVVDEITYRIWRLYMAGSAYNFDHGRLNVYQALLVKTSRGRSMLPLTRTDWYA